MMMNSLDKTIMLVIALLISFVIGKVGFEMSERKHCIKDGGTYSLDFGVCFKEGVVK
jgi:hypothetical protein